MKFRFLFFILFYATASFAQDRLYRAEDLPTLLAESQTNPKLKTERLIALEFHNLLNAHRSENNSPPLLWNDTLWLAARNHNLYMIAQEKLTHEQERGSKYFSGSEPQARLQYVQGRKGKLNYSGENCLMRGYYGDQIDADSWHDEETNTGIDPATAEREVIIYDAQLLLNQWISSPPHHRNMLSTWHDSHGASFVITNDEKIFGTDLFGERKN